MEVLRKARITQRTDNNPCTHEVYTHMGGRRKIINNNDNGYYGEHTASLTELESGLWERLQMYRVLLGRCH